MEPESFLFATGASLATAMVAAVTSAEVALERASRIRLRAAAAQGDRRARRLVGTEERQRRTDDLLSALIFARATLAAAVVLLAALTGQAVDASLTAAATGGVVGAVGVAVVQAAAAQVVSARPEASVLRLSWLALAVGLVFAVPAWLVSAPTRLLRPTPPLEPAEDLVALMEREEASGGVEEEERRMIRGIIALEEKTVREIMVPRIDIVAADLAAGVGRVAQLIVEHGYSRIPVYRETIDDIVGIVYAKDLLRALTNGREPELSELLREPFFVPESKRLDELLAELRRLRVHMAIVVDEYGGTAGLVTIEDLIEEIVGEIEDEYDVARSLMEVVSEDEAVLDASVPTEVLEELFGHRVESEEFDTLAGLVLHELGRLPRPGDEVVVGPLSLRVETMAGRRVRRLRVRRVGKREEPAPEEESVG